MNNNKHKARFFTIGCKLNQTETAQIETNFNNLGMVQSLRAGVDAPGLIFVNTCAVTVKAAAKSRHAIARLSRRYPDAKIIAAGCLAELDPHSLAAIPNVDYVVGSEAKFRTDWLNDLEQEAALIVVSESPDKLSDAVLSVDRHRARPFIKIQDGCEQNCTYCIIPALRGKPRSVPQDDILRLAKELINDGKYEIVLTGVRIGSWGRDLPGHPRLADLVENLAAIPTPHRIRLGSIEPWELDDRVIELVCSNDSVCPHLHVPLQHTVTPILNRMNRPSVREILSRLRKLRSDHGNLALGVDIICGFPGETDNDFELMLQNLIELNPTYIHTFGFSARPGTAATTMPEQVHSRTIKNRVNEVVNLSELLSRNFHRSQSGRTLTVIPDSTGENSADINVVSENYMRLTADGENLIPGRPVRIEYNWDEEGERLTNHV